MKTSAESYQSFLLRCWMVLPSTKGDPAEWRYALRTVSAEPTEQAFSSLEQLTTYLATELHQASDAEDRTR